MLPDAVEDQSPECLYKLLHAVARVHPTRLALTAPGRQGLSFERLVSQVEQLGRALRARQIATSDRVAVVLPNGPEMAVAFLGVAAFAACAPLNPAYRRDELEFYLTDLGAKAVVVAADTQHPVRELAGELGVAVIDLEFSAQDDAGEFTVRGGAPQTRPRANWGRADDVGLVLHTSGTTSRPKQVPLTQRNLTSSASNVAEVLQLTPDDISLNVMPLFHIHGLVGVLLSSIHAGGSVICTTGFDPGEFSDWFTQFQPTWYSAVPTIHQSVLGVATDHPELAGGRLRMIRSSSSALPPTVMAGLEEFFRVPVIESYGMTEAAHQMASNRLPPGQRKPGSVGLPAGPEMAIMDDAAKLLPAESIGEIVIRGRNVTAGYLNNDAANESAFSAGWFRTGDLGRTDADGCFFITGRKKEMINRGGENISPREVDEVLLQHADVTQAVAFAVPHPSLGEDVAAAVVLSAAAVVTEQQLRDFAFTKLADFKVPSKIIVVEEIPKGPTGKLQRIGLHEKLSAALQSQFVAPVGELETKLAVIWSGLLGRDQIGREDNFFISGGDSLAATGLLSRLRAEYGIELSLLAVFREPTLCAQAELVEQSIKESQHAEQHAIAEMLEQLEGISDEDAAELLEQQRDQRQDSSRTKTVDASQDRRNPTDGSLR